ncbi:MAG TPA: DUF4893 domain-containing protein [Rhizomicrobium sp.]|nr:DUF4893 domain-containing protein [Rhizomicrobium sp.]
MLALSLAAVFTSSTAFAGWQQDASAAEIDRLNQLPQIREAAIADAKAGDWRAVVRVMKLEARTIPANALTGNWRCRQIKLGLMSSTMVYDRWFTCTIRSTRGGLLLEKTGGSQRFAGFLYPEQGAWVYLGASSVRGESGHHYSGPSPALGAQVTPDDQIGLLTGIGDNHLRLEIPAVQESLLDVVEFAR